jgi:hypothetical protein
MKRLLIAAALGALPAEVLAGTLSCQFTEPFFEVTYDSATGTVSRISADVTDPDTGKPVPEILAEGAKLVSLPPDDYRPRLRLEKDGKTILELTLSGQGSDGMSESIYPFDGKYAAQVGGCETGKYPAYDTYDLLEDIGVR